MECVSSSMPYGDPEKAASPESRVAALSARQVRQRPHREDEEHDYRNDDLEPAGRHHPLFPLHLDRLLLVPERLLVVLEVLSLEVADFFQELNDLVVRHEPLLGVRRPAIRGDSRRRR